MTVTDVDGNVHEIGGAFEIVNKVKQQANDIDSVNQDRESIYSYRNQNGSSLDTNYTINDFGGSFLIPTLPTDKTVAKKTNLIEQMQNGSQVTADAMLEVAKEMAKSNSIAQTLVSVTENAGRNTLMGLMQLAVESTVSNKHKGIANKLTQIIGETQVLSNVSQHDYFDFQNKPISGLVDSKGQAVSSKPRELKAHKDYQSQSLNKFNNEGSPLIKDTTNKQIIPREAYAVVNAEKGLDETRMNNFNHGAMLQGIESEIDSLYEGNLFDEMINFYKDMDIDKIDDVINDTNEESQNA